MRSCHIKEQETGFELHHLPISATLCLEYYATEPCSFTFGQWAAFILCSHPVLFLWLRTSEHHRSANVLSTEISRSRVTQSTQRQYSGADIGEISATARAYIEEYKSSCSDSRSSGYEVPAQRMSSIGPPNVKSTLGVRKKVYSRVWATLIHSLF